MIKNKVLFLVGTQIFWIYIQIYIWGLWFFDIVKTCKKIRKFCFDSVTKHNFTCGGQIKTNSEHFYSVKE